MAVSRRLRGLGVIAAGLLLAGCAAAPGWRADHPQASAGPDACLMLLGSFDAAVVEAGVGDAGATRIAGFPYLRIDRFLASFRDELTSPAAFAAWVARLRALDAEARTIEAANLPAPVRQTLAARYGVPELAAAANACGERLARRELLVDPAAGREALLDAAQRPDHYRTWARVLGVYPLSRVGLAIGYAHWKGRNLDSFKASYEATPAGAPLRRYVPATAGRPGAEAVAALVTQAPRDALGIPALSEADVLRLAAHFAPVFEIATRSRDDLPGIPYWRSASGGLLPAVDVARPVVQVRLAYTRFDGAVLPQLVYTLWFPARPLSGPLDLYGGRLDGLVWRITLSEGGTPLIHDSMHPCGCYHLFFPVPPVKRVPVPQDDDLREAPLVPREAPVVGPGQRLMVRLAAATHYVRNLGVLDAVGEGEPPTRPYALQPVTQGPAFGTRSLALPGGGRRSLYDPDGLVPHTQRLERFLLWPAGIVSPGAMREWGTHVTAFVGRRHFDDPHLFERAFVRPSRE